jgi:hypothetical protein
MSDGQGAVTGLKILKAVVWIVYMLASAACIIIAFAFFLLMFNANTSAGFTQFIYTWGMKFSGPFVGIIQPTELESGGIIAWSALVAIAAYAVLAAIVGSILDSISRRLYRDTRRPVVGQSTVTVATPTGDGTVVTTATSAPIVGQSVVEQEETRRQAEAAAEAERLRQEPAAAVPDVAEGETPNTPADVGPVG